MVPNLPYFMVQWDYKGEKGYGHVIEGTGDSAEKGSEDAGGMVDEGDKGGGEFPRCVRATRCPTLSSLRRMQRIGTSRRRSLGTSWTSSPENGGDLGALTLD